MTEEPNARLRLEALALRHVMNLPAEDRAEAAEALAGASFHLVALTSTVARELDKTPGLELPDVDAMLNRPALKAEAEALDAAGWAGWASRPLDPRDSREAFGRVLADTAAAGDARRREIARQLLGQADAAGTAQERADLQAEAAALLERRARVDTGSPSTWWQEYLARNAGERVSPQESVQLAGARGGWAHAFNASLGPRGGLEPGRTLIIGGAPGAGKTSLGALLAVDALAAGCPVLIWQLELGRDEALEHMVAQVPQNGAWWETKFWNRARALPFPEGWDRLLSIPADPRPEAEDLLAAMDRMARRARRDRRAETLDHACNGLVVVDYAQLLTLRDRRAQAAGHEILSTAASRLAKAAAERGLCLVLLSQLNKGERQEGPLGDTALAGADLARVAHCAVFIQKGNKEGKPCKGNEDPHTDPHKGEARVLDWTKRRGAYHLDGRRPDKLLPLWVCHRALHGGETVSGNRLEGAA
jgi:hypothetical protein